MNFVPERSAEASWSGLYAEHLAEISRRAASALAEAPADAAQDRQNGGNGVSGREFAGVVFHAGHRETYYADDLAVPFRTLPHFKRFAPLPGPEHLLLLRPGEPVRLVRVVPADYWEETPALPAHPFVESLDVREAPSFEAAAVLLGDVADCAFIGTSPACAARLGLAPEAFAPRVLLARLDWARGEKTAYEVECIRAATRRAAAGHAAARAGALSGATEREIHAAYLAASEQLDGDTPYPNIIAWDDRAAVLHYQAKRATAPSPGHTFLIDAGATANGYASDITRTYALPGSHPVFREALDRMEALQQRLVNEVRPGRSYEALHGKAIRGVAEILSAIGVLRVGPEEAMERGLARAFLPHGLGHHLGLQVHDVGGQQRTPAGEHRPPSSDYPTLRTTRDLEAEHVVTIEPGLYFIPLLLEEQRAGSERACFDWSLIDALQPSGGIRIEDDIRVTSDGRENLTRPFVPGHLDAPLEPTTQLGDG